MLLLHMLFLSQHIRPYDFLVKGSVNLGGKTLRIQALKCFPCQFVFMVLERTMNALSWVEKKNHECCMKSYVTHKLQYFLLWQDKHTNSIMNFEKTITEAF